MPQAAAFLSSLPGWAQVTIATIIAIGAIIFAWKGVIPLFIHRAPKFHHAVMYYRDRVVMRNGKAVTKGPGPRGQFPGVISYLDTDMRQQDTKTAGFKVDIGTPATSYFVDGLSIVWRVFDAYLFQSAIADAERFIGDRVIQACRDLMIEEGEVDLSMRVITERCSRRIPTLANAGVELVSVMVTSGSYDTRNHRMIDGEAKMRRTVMMAEES